MATPLIYCKRFVKQAAAVVEYLETNWSTQDADSFMNQLLVTLTTIQQYPETGSLTSSVQHVRSISVTRHNRIFYKVYPNHIAILNLKDTRKRAYKR